jgi:5-oxoprolinase (ATP-hydrolysing) subunit A
MQIDLNCDLGEGFPFDAELMPFITSANVSCGYHAGDAATALSTLKLAAQHHVQVGAHPGYADREHFGRRELDLSEAAIFQECTKQVEGLAELADQANMTLHYIKPHGALYNQACRDLAYARPIVRVAEAFRLAVMGLPDSKLQTASIGHCPFVAEGFADRRYLSDGSLVPRSQPNAFVEDAEEAVRLVEKLLHTAKVQTLCVHGDNPQAVVFVKALRSSLQAKGIDVKASDVKMRITKT